MFVDFCGDGRYRAVGTFCTNGAPVLTKGETLSTYTLRTGFTINSLCAGTAVTCAAITGSVPNTIALDVLFKRPNPDAVIVNTGNMGTTNSYAKIGLKASDGSLKNIVIQSSGQVEITN